MGAVLFDLNLTGGAVGIADDVHAAVEAFGSGEPYACESVHAFDFSTGGNYGFNTGVVALDADFQFMAGS